MQNYWAKIAVILSVIFLDTSLLQAQTIPSGTYYLIVTTQNFSAGAEQIRLLRSFDVSHQAAVVTIENINAQTAGPNLKEKLRNFLRDQAYPAGVEYVLLIGDHPEIPAAAIDPNNLSMSDSDFYYTTFNGAQQMAIGRITPNNLTELNNYYQKLVSAGNQGYVIPNGSDRIAIYQDTTDIFVEAQVYSNNFLPYMNSDVYTWLVDAGNNNDIFPLISNHSLGINTWHGFGHGAIVQNNGATNPPFMLTQPTNLKGMYFAFGCQSGNFTIANTPAQPDAEWAERNITAVGLYSMWVGAMRDHFETQYGRLFFKSFLADGVQRVGDMLLWTNAQSGVANLYTLLGDPYLKPFSLQMNSMPRIFVDFYSGDNQRTFINGVNATVDPVNVDIRSFNGGQWAIENIVFNNPAMNSHVNFSSLNGTSSINLQISFNNLSNLSNGDYTIDFDIKDQTNNLLVRHKRIYLTISSVNSLDSNDFIVQGNIWTLPVGYYTMFADFTIPTGKKLIVNPGVAIKTDSSLFSPAKLIISAGAKLEVLGSVTQPVYLKSLPGDWAPPVIIEVHSDGTNEYLAKFQYTVMGSSVIGVGNPRLEFDNVTFLNINFNGNIFPNPIRGKMTNSVITQSGMGWPIQTGYLYDLQVSYSLIPAETQIQGEGIIFDTNRDTDFDGNLRMTSLAVNAGNPSASPDPDGTRKDMGALTISLNNALRVPQDFSTIQQALNAASAGAVKVVKVASGNYQENLVLPPGVRLMGAFENDRPVLSGSSTGSLLQINPTFNEPYLIENFIITHQGQNQTGRAITIFGDEILSMRNILFLNNQQNESVIYTSSQGGSYGPTVNLSQVQFENNHHNQSILNLKIGGIGKGYIKDVIFESNQNNQKTISFELASHYSFPFENVQFVNNANTTLISHKTATDYSWFDPYALKLNRCVFDNNQNTKLLETDLFGHTLVASTTFYNNGNRPLDTMEFRGNSNVRLVNSILWNNSIQITKAPSANLLVDYTNSNTVFPATGAGNLNVDPMFLAPGAGDFRLNRISPSRNAGDPASVVPLNGGSAIDQGAFEVMEDSSVPITPIVTDQGQWISLTNSLSASWISDDPETGVVSYQYCVTEGSVSGSVIQPWTQTNSNIVSVNGLNLQPGKIYYFSVKSQNGAGLLSAIGYSDGISIQRVRKQPCLVGQICP